MLVLIQTVAIATLQPAPMAGAPALPLGTRVAEVRRFAQAEGEALWPGYGSAPFEFLLVDAKEEILLCRDLIPSGFKAAGYDREAGCKRAVRPRSGLPDNLLAAMPLFGPPSTIVMGTPETTGRTQASWIRTILHEHFHQWQNALPSYYARTSALGLTSGDQTGMWMLNYPFPYDRPEVVAAQSAASNALADAVAARGTADFRAKLDAYLAKRSTFQAAVSARDWRYAELQLWQEGVARWTEIQLGKSYRDEAVATSAATLEERTLKALREPDLAGQKREFAYAYGAGEAMLLAACGPKWREHYPTVLELGSLLSQARAACAHPL